MSAETGRQWNSCSTLKRLENIFAERCHNRPFSRPLYMRGQTVLVWWRRHAGFMSFE